MIRALLALLLLVVPIASAADAPAGKQESSEGITHGFLAFGAETYRVDSDGRVTWSFAANTRDGWLLPSGNILLAVSKAKDYPGGGAVELKPDGTVVWSYKGSQSEVNTVQLVGDGRYMLTEAGPKPRLIEVDRAGKVLVDIQLQAQTQDFHLQTRMARKLPSGNYLVPQLLDKVVREYAPDGKVVWEAKTPDAPAEAWPFTAIRLPDGNTLVTCTHSKMVVEFDKDAKVVWRVTNDDLPEPMLIDPCGAQRLPNGNTVITSYGQGTPGEVKLIEISREKHVVWTYRDPKNHGIHEFQITETNGKPLAGPAMK
jgi:hypothetical protein